MRAASISTSPEDAGPLLAAVREGVAAKGATGAWEEVAVALASAAGMEVEEAELALAKALGWKAWFDLNRPVYLKPKLPPPPATVRAALQWLVEGPLRLSPTELHAALSNSPLVYLREPERSYSAALKAAPKQFSEPGSFRELLLREPSVLDLTWNCETTDPASRPLDAWGEAIHCDGQCTHCWRTATPRLMGQVLDGVEV